MRLLFKYAMLPHLFACELSQANKWGSIRTEFRSGKALTFLVVLIANPFTLSADARFRARGFNAPSPALCMPNN